MVDVISVENMRLSDAAAINGGIPSLELMHRAAQGIYDLSCPAGKTAIVVGSGNNGGDGFALACIMAREGNIPDVITVTDHYSQDSTYYMEKAVDLSVRIIDFKAGEDIFMAYDTIIDCLLGTGFKGEARGIYKDAIEEINDAGSRMLNGHKRKIICADINSGLNGDTGEGTYAVNSDLTVSIGSHKRGVILAYLSGNGIISEVASCDIGIRILKEEDRFLTDDEWFQMGFPPDKRIYKDGSTYYR